ncbi:MAG: protein kinase [candidate division KSB1 bacterium]|nr:protein kinase [candidate division KSB1 bacterium]
MIGTTISHYKILEKLGSGGMGIVYKAEDTKLKRLVALKFLPSFALASEEEKTRFIHEAQAAAALNHPNICTIHEIDEVDGQSFIAMEFVEGQSLKEKIEAGPLKLDEALNIAVQVAEGLQAAHEKKITHRDIKPANVMITSKGQAKIMDFGLAKLAGRTVVTKEGMTLGTVAYMSPEQARGEEVDHRTDIWAFGVVFYEMITGQLPFKGLYEQAVVYSILNENPEPITGLRTGVPMELERIVNKAMAKKTDERYQHVGEMLVDLRAIRKTLESPSVAAKSKAVVIEPAKSRRALRHVGVGIAALLVGLIAASLWFFSGRGKAINSLAVLPFVNVGADPETEYLSDGITESLIQGLSRLPRLKVMSLSSVLRYKGQEVDVSKVGQALKVRAVLTGRLVQRGENLSISAELVNAQDNSHIWGEQYHRKLAEILALQAELSKKICEQLQLRLSGEERQRLSKSYGENAEAYQLYLKGRYYAAKSTEDAFEKAVEYVHQAIVKAPNYALAYVGLAEAYYAVSSIYLPPKEAMPRVKEAALKAIEIDNTLAEAHAALALVKAFYDWDSPGAESEFKQAIALNPNYEYSRLYYGAFLVGEGRFEEGLAEMKRAQEIDPLSLLITDYSALLYIYARQYDRTIKLCQSALDMEANYWPAHVFLGMAHQLKGNLPAAIAAFQKAKQLDDNPWILIGLGHAYAASGMRAKANKTLEALRELSKHRFVSAYGIARIYTALGEKDQAFAWLQRAYDDRDENVAMLKFDPFFDNLRSDPRFATLLKKWAWSSPREIKHNELRKISK